MSNPASVTVSGGDVAYATHSNNLRRDAISGIGQYDLATGSLSAYNVSGDGDIGTYSAGLTVTFRANHTNTGSSTLNYRGYGARTIKKAGNITDLDANDILSSSNNVVKHNGTNFELMSSLPIKASADEINQALNGINSNVTKTNLNKLTSFSDSTILHSHQPDIGSFTRAQNAGTGLFTVSHSLNVVPTLIEIDSAGVLSFAGSNQGVGSCKGYATGISDERSLVTTVDAGTSVLVATNSTNIVYLINAVGGESSIANVTAINSVSFTLNFTVHTDVNLETDPRFLWKVSAS